MDPIPLFRKFLTDAGLTQAEAAKRLGVSAPTMHDWLTGAKRPTAVWRDAIERLSSGSVPASSWVTPEERTRVARVRPVKPAA